MVTKAYRAQTRIFIEEMDVDGDNIFPTGEVIEMPLFDSVTWSTSSSFNKSATINMSNPLEQISTSIRHAKGFYKGGKLSDDSYLTDYDNFIAVYFDEDRSTLNPEYEEVLTGTAENDLLKDDFIYGVKKLPAHSYTGTEDIGFVMVPMQRVWIVTHTDGLGNEITLNEGSSKERWSVWAGILSGFQESYASESDSTITATVKGLSRFMELTDVFSNFRLSRYQGTLNDKYAKVINDGLYSKFKGVELLGSLKPAAFLTLPVFLANFFYTQMGNDINYDVEFGAEVVSNDFFLKQPIWKLNTNSSDCWQQITEGDTSMAYGILKPFEEDGIDTLKDLWEGNSVETWQMLPSVHIDPLILELFDDTELAIMKKQLQGSFELTDNNMINCKDMLVKAAQAIMASAYEDDFGNIIFEVAKTWNAPHKGKGFIADSVYASSGYEELLLDGELNLDYVITDTDIDTSNKSFDEGNLVTYVETPANYQFIEQGEDIQRRHLTGMLSDTNTDNIELQRRFGVRLLTTTPLVTNTVNMGLETYQEFKKALDTFAGSAKQLRNYSTYAASITTNFLHWLKVNKNILWHTDGALWLITDKNLSYSQEGSLTCTFTLTLRHRIKERVGYPFLDIYIEG